MSERGLWKGIPCEVLLSGNYCGEPRISPTSKQVAFVRDGNLWIRELTKLDPLEWQLTSGYPLGAGTEYGSATYCWTSKGEFLYFVSSGNLYRVSINGGITPLFCHTSGIKIYSPVCSPTGQILGFCMEDHNSISIGVLRDPEIVDDLGFREKFPEKICGVEKNADFCYDLDFHPKDPTKLLFHGWQKPHMSWTSSFIYLYDFTTNSVTTVSGGPNEACSQPRFSPSGNKISFVSDKSGFHNLWVKIGDQQPTHLLQSDEIALLGVWNSGNSSYQWINENKIVFATVKGGFCQLHLLELTDQLKVTSVKKISEWDGLFSNISARENSIVFFYEDYKTKGKTVLINTDTLETTILVSSGIRHSPETINKFVKPIPIDYPTTDNQTAHGLLFLGNQKSSKTEPLPLLMIVHGGPNGLSANRFGGMSAWMQYYATRGWLVFAPNYRGSWSHGREYRMSLNENWGKADTDDIHSALEFLIKYYNADSSRCAIMGASAGGYAVLKSMCDYPGLWAAGVNICGVADLFNLDKDTHLLERHYNVQLVGNMPQAIPKYYSRSPIFHAQKIVDPLLTLQGAKDTVVPKEQSRAITQKTKGISIYHEFATESHVFKSLESWMEFYKKSEEFLIQYVLQGEKYANAMSK